MAENNVGHSESTVERDNLGNVVQLRGPIFGEQIPRRVAARGQRRPLYTSDAADE